jgi:hypothetical protein
MSDHYLTDPRANTWEGWKAAFDIFARHHKPMSSRAKPDAVHFSAEHDILFISKYPSPLSTKRGDGHLIGEWADDTKADAMQLEALGFHWSSEGDCWAKFT